MALAAGTADSRALLARLVSGTRVEDLGDAVTGMSRRPGGGPSVYAVVTEAKHLPSCEKVASKGLNAGKKFMKKESVRLKARVLSIENVNGTLNEDMSINEAAYAQHRKLVSEKLELRAKTAISSGSPLYGPLAETRAAMEHASKKTEDPTPATEEEADGAFGSEAAANAFGGQTDFQFGQADHAQGTVTQIPDEAEAIIKDFPNGGTPAPDPMAVFIETQAPDTKEFGGYVPTFPTHAKLRIGGLITVEIMPCGVEKLLDLEKGSVVKLNGLRAQKPYYQKPTHDISTGEKKFGGGWFTTWVLTIGLKSTGATQSELYSAFGATPCEPIPIPPVYIDGEPRLRYDMPVSVSTEPDNPSSGWRDTEIVQAKTLTDHKESFCSVDNEGNFKSPVGAFLTLVTSVIGMTVQTAYVRVDARDMIHFLLGDVDIPPTETTSAAWKDSTVRKWGAMTWCLYGKGFSFSSRGHVDAKGSTTISDSIGSTVGDGDAARRIDTAVSIFSQTFSVKWDEVVPAIGIKADVSTLKHLCGIASGRNSVDSIHSFARGHKGRFFRAAGDSDEKLIVSSSENEKCNYEVEIYMLPTVSPSTLEEMRSMPLAESSSIIDKCLSDDTDNVPESVKGDIASLKKEFGSGKVFHVTFFARITGDGIERYDVDSDPIFSELKASISADNERRRDIERLASGTMVEDSPDSGAAGPPAGVNRTLTFEDETHDASASNGQLTLEAPVAAEPSPQPKTENKRKEVDPSTPKEEEAEVPVIPEPPHVDDDVAKPHKKKSVKPPVKEHRREKKKPRT